MMNKYINLFFLFCLLLLGQNTYAQISEGGIPPSFAFGKSKLKSEQKTDFTTTLNLNIEQLRYEDKINKENGIPPRVGVVIPVDIKYPNSGNWIELSKEQKVWQLSIEAPDAVALSLYYKDFYIPQGAKLFIYNTDGTHIIGAYTEKTNSHAKNFATEFIAGDKIILEYVPAKGQTEEPKISISGINYGYNNLSVQYNGNMGYSQSCQVNIGCETQWNDQRDGVYKVLFAKDGNVFLCTGSMLNNTLQDFTPYSLTAFHCIDGVNEADMNSSIFYFNYQKATCNGIETDIDVKTMVGASVLVSTALEGNSDGALIKLNQNIPVEYNVYYNGWDHRGVVPKSGASVHHPAGDVKKIATYDNNTASTSWNNDLARDTHWKIYWDSGLTEGGSSGAPLFNEDKNIIGSLSGAPNYPDPCSVPGNHSLFGKLSSFWENADVKQYLDPTGLVYSRLSGTRSPHTLYINFTILNNIEEIYVGQTLIVKNESIVEQQSLIWKVIPPSGVSATYTTQDLSIPLIEEGNYTILLETAEGALVESQNFTAKTRKGKIKEVTIGNGTITNYGMESPLGQQYTLTRTASAYTPTELGGAGSITSLSWETVDELSIGRKLQVYLKHISSETISSNWDDNIAGATLVYTSPDNWSNIKGWNLINLDMPFEYDGTSHLQVLTVSEAQGELKRVSVYFYSTGTRQYKSWGVNGQATTTSATPNIKIGISRPISLASPSTKFAYAVKVWEEGFDDSESLSEWTVDTSSGNGWQIGETMPPFSDIDPLSKKSILVGENSGINARTKLISPTIPVPANSPRIEFHLAHGRGNGMIDFAISEDGGTTWNHRVTIDQNPLGGDWSWEKHEIDISSYQDKNIKLMFIVSGENGLVALDGLKLLSLEEEVKIKQGEYIYPVDLSTGVPNTYDWDFPSASPSSSSNSNPGAIKYSIPGKYDIGLTATNALGTDTYLLPQSVNVDPHLPIPLFEAKGGYQMYPDNGRFIPLGTDVEFTDKSIHTDNIEWEFSGGNPSTSTIMKPTVSYTSKGDFDVELKAYNQYIGLPETSNKTGYVKVGGSSKIWNIPQGNAGTTTYDKIGTNSDGFTIFAERFDKTTFGLISEVDILFQVSSANDENIFIRVHSVGDDGLPNEVLAQKELNIQDINSTGYTTIQFDSPIPVDVVFFISASVNDISSDIKILASTANTGKNTAYLQYDDFFSYWSTIKTEFNMDLSLNIVPTFKFAGSYKLKFDSQGGETIADADVIYYQSVGELPTPQRNTFTFKGWFWDLEDPSSIYSNYAIYEFEADKTLYALWEENLPELTIADAEFTYNGASQTQSAAIIPAELTINYSYIGIDGTNYNSTTAPVDAGTYEVTAVSVANTEYASTTTATLTIKKANVSINITPKTEAYSGNPIQLDYTVSGGTATKDNLMFTTQYDGIDGTIYNSSSAPSEVGKYKATISTVGDNNHNRASETGILTITEGSINSFTMTPDYFVYDGTAKTLTATIVPILPVSYSYQGTLKDGTAYAETTTAPTEAGDYTVTAKFLGNGTYLPASISAQMEIKKKVSKVILENTTANYTGNPININVKETDPVSAALTIDYVKTTRFFIKNRAAAPTDVGVYTATATFAGNNNYESGMGTATLTIQVSGKPTLTMDNKTITYNDSPQAIDPAIITGPSTAPQELSIAKYTYQNADYPASETAPTDAGVYSVVAETTISNNFPTAGTVSATLTIEKAHQTITFDAGQLQGKTYGDSPITLIASSTSGLPITFESGNPLIAEINDNKLTIKAAGTVSITARQGGNKNYNAAPLVTHSMTIAPSSLVINIDDPQEATYIGANLHVKPATATGIVGGASLPIVYEYKKDGQTTASAVNAGDYKVLVKIAGDNNHAAANREIDFEVKKADVTINLTSKSVPYTGLPISIDAPVLSGSATVGNLSVTISYEGINGTSYPSSSQTPTNGGEYMVTVNTVGDKNHNAKTNIATLTITQSTAVITLTDNTFVYDGTTKSLVATTVPASLPITYTYSGTLADGTNYPSTSEAPSQAGVYTVMASFAGNANHEPTSAAATLTIDKKESVITLKNKTETYTGFPIAIDAPIVDPIGAVVTITYQRVTRAMSLYNTQAPSDVGIYTATATFAGDNNHKPGSATANLSITAAGVPTLNMENKKVVYNGNPQAIDPAIITGPSTAPQELSIAKYTYQNADYPASETAPTDAGVYSVVAETTISNNFPTAETVSATLTIEKAHQTITFDAGQLQGKMLGDTPFSLVANSTFNLPISFVSGNPAIASIIGNEVTILQTGVVSITAMQDGNKNYHAASVVTHTLSITSDDVDLHLFEINGESHNISERFIVPKDYTEGTIRLHAEVENNATIQNLPPTVDVNKPSIQTIEFSVKSQDGTVTKNYTLEVEKRFQFDELVIVRWNNTITVVNRNNPYGYQFRAYQWYKNGSPISSIDGGTLQSYSVGKNGEALNPNDSYYVEVTDLATGQVLRCWESEPKLRSMRIVAYPLPVEQGNIMILDADIDAEYLEGATIYLHNIIGTLVKVQKVTGRQTSISMNLASGTYILTLTGTKGFNTNIKVIVK